MPTIPTELRIIMYDYMTLPPFPECWNYSGYYLSCRQFKNEIDEAATKQLKLYLQEWASKTAQTIHSEVRILPSADSESWKSISVSFRFLPWDESSLDTVIPLYNLYLDDLTIHLSHMPHFAMQLSKDRIKEAKEGMFYLNSTLPTIFTKELPGEIECAVAFAFDTVKSLEDSIRSKRRSQTPWDYIPEILLDEGALYGHEKFRSFYMVDEGFTEELVDGERLYKVYFEIPRGKGYRVKSVVFLEDRDFKEGKQSFCVVS